MVLKGYQERLVMLVKDTLTLLCKNGLEYSQEFAVEGLLGITLDKDEVFLIPINELVRDKVIEPPPPHEDDVMSETAADDRQSPKRKKKRRHQEAAQPYEDTSLEPGGRDNRERLGMEPAPDTTHDDDDEPSSKRHRNKVDLSNVKAEDIVVIKEEDDDDNYEGFQDNSMDNSRFNQAEPGGDGLPFFPQAGTSQGEMDFSLEQLPSGSGIPGAMGMLPEGNVSSWLQQSQDGSQGDWQGQAGDGDGQKQQWACDLCQRKFRCRSWLIRHRDAIHLKLSHKCDICGRGYTQTSALLRHKRTAHSNNDPTSSNPAHLNESSPHKVTGHASRVNRKATLIHPDTSHPYVHNAQLEADRVGNALEMAPVDADEATSTHFNTDVAQNALNSAEIKPDSEILDEDTAQVESEMMLIKSIYAPDPDAT